jgi:uncharacterized membrane protein
MTETMSRLPSPTTAPMSRWVWAVLVASLAVNCVVLGVVLRFAWAGHGPGGPGGPNGPASILQYTETLPPDRRDSVRGAVAADRAVIRNLRSELRAARREAARELVAEPFDKARFATAQGRVSDLEGQLRQEFTRALPEMAARMTPQERRALLRWRDARLPPGQRWNDQDDNRP